MAQYFKKIGIVSTVAALALFFSVNQANAAVNKTCPTANNFVTCTPDFVCGGGATQCSATLPADPDPQNVDRYSLNCSAVTCNASAWQCNTTAYPCGGSACTGPTSVPQTSCSTYLNGTANPNCHIGGVFIDRCGAIGCPAGKQLCSRPDAETLFNTCVAEPAEACPAGTTFDPCTSTCSTPYFLKNQVPETLQQAGYLNITGYVNAVGGLASVDSSSLGGYLGLSNSNNNQLIRVDNNSAWSNLTIENSGTGGALNMWINGSLNLGASWNGGSIAPIQLGTNQNLLYGAISGVAPGATNVYLMKLQNPINTNVFTIDPNGNINTTGGATFGGPVTFNSTVNIGGTNNLGVNGDLLVGGGYSAGGITLVGTGADKGKLQVGNGIVLKGQVYQEDVQELRVQNNKIVLNANGAAQNATIQVNASTGSIGWNEAGKKWTIGDSLATPSLCLGSGASAVCKSAWSELNTNFLPLTGGILTGKLTINHADGLEVNGKITASGCFGPVFTGVTTVKVDGALVDEAVVDKGIGYIDANAICQTQYSGSHVCTNSEMLNSISCGVVFPVDDSDAWIFNGAPSLPVQTNDCNGWTVNGAGDNGVAWQFTVAGKGGIGWAMTCDNKFAFACCK